MASRSLEQQLEYCACHCESLRQLLKCNTPEALRLFGAAISTYLFQRVFEVPSKLWRGVVVSGLALLVACRYVPFIAGITPLALGLGALGLLLFALPLGFAFSQAPRYIVSRARLVAVLDCLCEREIIDMAQLTPPVEYRAWVDRATAHWFSSEAAPD